MSSKNGHEKSVQVRVTAVLQKHVGGLRIVDAPEGTVDEVFEDIDRRFPGFKGQVYGEDGQLHRFVNIYLNDEDIRYMGGTDVRVAAGDTLDILPALAGGR